MNVQKESNYWREYKTPHQAQGITGLQHYIFPTALNPTKLRQPRTKIVPNHTERSKVNEAAGSEQQATGRKQLATNSKRQTANNKFQVFNKQGHFRAQKNPGGLPARARHNLSF
jgi:hypothetical protein